MQEFGRDKADDLKLCVVEGVCCRPTSPKGIRELSQRLKGDDKPLHGRQP